MPGTEGAEIRVFTYPQSAADAAQAAWEERGGMAAFVQGSGARPVPSRSPEEIAAGLSSAENAAEASRSEGAARGAQAEELRRSFEAGREAGRKEARMTEATQQQEALARMRQDRTREMAGLLERFEASREQYLHAVEQEVVTLALGIAARILRREAQMDALLLTGAVRVALGQLAETTTVRLRVPADDADLWREAVAHLPNLAVRPEVLAEPLMRLGDCVLETEVGSVDLGVRAQLREIEHGFFDRARAAPTQIAEGLQPEEAEGKWK